MALPTVYLTSAGYSGGSVHLIANTSVLFNYDLFGPPVQYGIEINTGTTDITFEASNMLSSGDTMDISFIFLNISGGGVIIRNFTNYAACTDFSSKNNYFAKNEGGVILTFKQYGTFSTFTNPGQALFLNNGPISKLYNSDNFYIAGRLPEQYFIKIQDLSTYGKLTFKEPDAGNLVNMNFDIDPSGSIMEGTYANVLSNISIFEIADTSGVYLGYPWSLVANGSNWDLVVESNIVYLTSAGYSGGGNDVRAVSDIVFDNLSAQAIYTLTGTTDLSFYPGYTISALGTIQYFLINNATIGSFNNQAVLTNNFMYFAANFGTIGDLYNYGQMRGKYNPPVDGANFWNIGTISNIYNSDNFFIQDNLPINYYARIVSDVSYGTLMHIPSTSDISMNFYIDPSSNLQDGQTYVGVLQNIQSSEFSPQSGNFDGLFDWTLVNNGFDTWDLVVTAVSNIVYLTSAGYSGGGNDVIATFDSSFNLDVSWSFPAAIWTHVASTSTNFLFELGCSISRLYEGDLTGQAFLKNEVNISNFINYGVLTYTAVTEVAYFSMNTTTATIDNFYSYGQMVGEYQYPEFNITNGAIFLNDGTITNLYNSDQFVIDHNFPVNYYELILSDVSYGSLTHKVIPPPPSMPSASDISMNFYIDPSSTLLGGHTYASVLRNITADALINTSGTFNGLFDWTLVNNGFDIWDLVIARRTIYLEPEGYSGGGDEVRTNADVIFNSDLLIGINNSLNGTTYYFYQDFTITAPATANYLLYNSATITQISNFGTLVKDHPTDAYFALNDVGGMIDSFLNYGRIYNPNIADSGAVFINSGTLTSLYNASEFVIMVNLPENYYEWIVTDASYGSIIKYTVPLSGAEMNFDIYPSSTLRSGYTYTNVLQGIQASEFTPQTGTFNEFSWTLMETLSGNWDLVIARRIIYLDPSGYSGGGDEVIANVDVSFNSDLVFGINNASTGTTLEFQLGVTVTASWPGQLLLYNSSTIDLITNNGILRQSDPNNLGFATNDGIITEFYNYGQILSDTRPFINLGELTSLYNVGAFYFAQNLPLNYYISINSPSEYGTLIYTGASLNPMTFHIDPASVLLEGHTYKAVLQGVPADQLSNTLDEGLQWALINNTRGQPDTWDLAVAHAIVILDNTGYSGGGDLVLANADVSFDENLRNGLYSVFDHTRIVINANSTVTASWPEQTFLYNTSRMDSFENYGTLQQTDPENVLFALNAANSYIVNFFNYGTIETAAPFQNDGVISNLYNGSALFLTEQLPINYYVLITNETTYGTLRSTSTSADPRALNFLIDPSSVLMAGGVYPNVLENIAQIEVRNTRGRFYSLDPAALEWALVSDVPSGPNQWVLAVQDISGTPFFLDASGYIGGGSDVLVLDNLVMAPPSMPYALMNLFDDTTITIQLGVTVDSSGIFLLNSAATTLELLDNSGILRQTATETALPYFLVNNGTINAVRNKGTIRNTNTGSRAVFNNLGTIVKLTNFSSLYLAHTLPYFYYIGVNNLTSYGALIYTAGTPLQPMFFGVDPTSVLAAGARYARVLQNVSASSILTFSGTVGTKKWTLVNSTVAVAPLLIRAHALDPTSWDLVIDSTPVPPTPTPSTAECLYVCPPKVLAKKNLPFNGNTNDSTRTNAFAYAQLARRRAGQNQIFPVPLNEFGYYAGAPSGSGAPPRNKF